MFEIKEVQWRNIKDYEGYQVSDNGWVKSLNYMRTGHEKILSQRMDRYGYLKVSMCKNSTKTFLVHKLVAEAFITNPEGKPQVNHINENKLKNTIDNLNWMTAQENMNWGTRTARQVTKTRKPIIATKDGIDHYFESGRQAAKELNIYSSHISACLKGKLKTTGGYQFKYATVSI